MRNWGTISGGFAWAIVAVLLVMAALQPVTVSASAGDGISLVYLCADGSPALAMGCESIYL
jgi:hypothetical protein